MAWTSFFGSPLAGQFLLRQIHDPLGEDIDSSKVVEKPAVEAGRADRRLHCI